MTKKVMLLALFVVLAFAFVWAGDKKATTNAQMDAMKAEMMKCAVCKNMAMQMDAMGPCAMEVTTLNDGMAMRHWVKSEDAKKIAAFHTGAAACSKAGQACMTMTDEQAKTDLCPFCQDMRSAMKAGAKMSYGTTKKGDLMVITSPEPTVQAQITNLRQQCEQWAASMEAPPATTTATTEKK
ncbi:MAG TPA: hypothetical protein VI546_05195 [candidate division Zixibacteria bacterium]|nr:hypothetical protein [candidate division Zixibacteria bacterium]